MVRAWTDLDDYGASNVASYNLVMIRFQSATNGVGLWGAAVRWSRTVSPAPATATFGDVPTGSSCFRFVEALADAGITGGCGGGNYCPDDPLTRGQMAVFLAVALGLHWPL